MAKLSIITIPDPMLRSASAPIERVDDEMQALIDDMLETMYEAPGVGLAAVQVAVPRRLIVMDVTRDEDVPKKPIAMINPEIVWLSDEARAHEEGCLSMPEVFVEIERPSAVRVTYIDREGELQEMMCEDLLATVVQHEIDHLNGKLFVDHLSRLKRDRLVKKFIKDQRERNTVA